MELSPEILILAALIFFCAALIHGSIGFGFPMLATPLLALVTKIQSAIIITLIPTLLVNIVSIASEGGFRDALRWHLPLSLLAMAVSAIGTLILIFSNSQIFEALLSLAIFVYLLAGQIKFNFAWVHQRPFLSRVIFGLTAGILGGLTNVMAPVLIIYSLESKHTKSETIQAANSCFMFGKTIQLLIFAMHGQFNAGVLSMSAVMLIVVSLALYLGIGLRKKIDADAYQGVLRVVLLILAISLLIKVVLHSGME